MEVVTVHVPVSCIAIIACPFCGKSKEVSLAKFAHTKNELSVKCSCNQTFKVILNFRKYYRKPVTLFGQYMNLSSNALAWAPAIFTDLSLGGLRLKTESSVGMQIGDTLRVQFKLDGKKPVIIDKEVKVRFTKDNIAGCEFLNLSLEEKDLGFYLLKI